MLRLDLPQFLAGEEAREDVRANGEKRDERQGGEEALDRGHDGDSPACV